MNNSNHLRGGEHVREVIEKPKPEHHAVKQVLQETLDFYLNSSDYAEVYLVKCNGCGQDMCLEVLEPATQHQFAETHHEGRRRITLGFEDAPDGYLLSHRKRLDGAMGYECICGNTTIIAESEQGLARKHPSGGDYLPPLEPHQVAKFRANLAKAQIAPDIEANGDVTRIESFTVERLK